MGGRVILLGGVAIRADGGCDRLTDAQRAVGESAAVDHSIGDFRRCLDDEPAGARRNHAGVADLAAGLGVETGLVENQANLGFTRNLPLLVKADRVDPAEDRGVALVRAVLVQIFRRRQVAVGQARQERIGLLRRPGPLLLLLHQLLEPVEVHVQAAFLGHKLRQVDGEAVGVVKLESIIAADGPGGGLCRTVGGGGKEV